MAKRRLKMAADGRSDIAGLDFEPVPAPFLANLVRLTTWKGLNNPHLMNVRIAAEILSRTKASLAETARELFEISAKGTSEDGSPATLYSETLESFVDSAKRFRAFAELLEKAQARLLVALAASETATLTRTPAASEAAV